MESIRVHGIVRESIVDGPGIRYLVFTQGCTHNCKGCHNKETHSLEKGYDLYMDKIVHDIMKNPLLDGISISGGEPFLQARALSILCKRVRDLGLSTLIYTGYVFEDLLDKSSTNKDYESLLSYTDILIDGPFIEKERDMLLKFRGSSNQRIIDVASSIRKEKTIEIDF